MRKEITFPPPSWIASRGYSSRFASCIHGSKKIGNVRSDPLGSSKSLLAGRGLQSMNVEFKPYLQLPSGPTRVQKKIYGIPANQIINRIDCLIDSPNQATPRTQLSDLSWRDNTAVGHILFSSPFLCAVISGRAAAGSATMSELDLR